MAVVVAATVAAVTEATTVVEREAGMSALTALVMTGAGNSGGK